MNQRNSQVDIGIDENREKISLVLSLDDFVNCTKKSWEALRNNIIDSLIEQKIILPRETKKDIED